MRKLRAQCRTYKRLVVGDDEIIGIAIACRVDRLGIVENFELHVALLKDREPLRKDRSEQEHDEGDTRTDGREPVEAEATLRAVATRKAITHLLLRLGR